MNDVTQVLNAAQQGDPQAADRLLPLVYEELRRLAAARLAQEPSGQTLQPTALVHEAYVRLVGTHGEARWDSRGHFFAAAAQAMRRILIDNARRKQRRRHGGGRRRSNADVAAPGPEMSPEDLLDLDSALDRLSREEPDKAEVVKLRFFAGLTMPEVAEVLGISLATAERHWNYARTWLYAELKDGGEVSFQAEKWRRA